jgi:hypothetical protein
MQMHPWSFALINWLFRPHDNVCRLPTSFTPFLWVSSTVTSLSFLKIQSTIPSAVGWLRG